MVDKFNDKKLQQVGKEPDKESVDSKGSVESLFGSETMYQALFKKSLNPIMVVDENGRYVAANRAALDFFECGRDDLVGKDIWEVCPPDCLKKQEEGNFPCINRRTFETEYLVRGKIKSVLLNVVPLTVSGEKFLYTIGHKVSHRKKSGREKEPLADQIQHARKMEAVRTLAGGIAHKFNNLLMSIQGYASLMLMDIDSAHPHFKSLKGVEGVVKQGADITKQLLGLAGDGKYEVKAIDLNDLIKKTSEMFGRSKEDIKIKRKSQRNIWTIEADRMQIEQVLLNFYVNAWQAMPGGGEILIETENVTLDKDYVKPFNARPGKYVKVSVTDTGVGMDKAIQQRIFEPFFTTKDIGNGIGLGLASAYGIIKSHGGIVTVYSKKGEGTTFDLYLPASARKAARKQKTSEGLLKGTETLLFVDDDDTINSVGTQMLELMGYKVLSATSGEEAIEVYKKNMDKISMIILDMIMPGMGGGETHDRLKEINPNIRVLLSSGYSADGEAKEILKHGCGGFIQKPFDINSLSSKIREMLDERIED